MEYLFSVFRIFCAVIGCFGFGWFLYGTIFPANDSQRGVYRWVELLMWAGLIALGFG